MRSLVVAWLERHGLPGWLAPDYMVMVGLAALIGAAITQRLSRRDGADVGLEGRALVAAYAGALLGGYVLEWLRMLPEALAAGSLHPFFRVGRAAYGGLLVGALAAGVLLSLAKVAFGLYATHLATSIHVLWGAIAFVPLLLVWVLLAWCIMLFAAEITAALQDELDALEAPPDSPRFFHGRRLQRLRRKLRQRRRRRSAAAHHPRPS